MRMVFLLVAVLSCILTAPVPASEGPPPKLNPKTYKSPSGEYELFVNPSDQHGVGKGTYTLRQRGAVLWTKTQPYTFWEAGVTDTGTSVGYAYSHGFQGWGAPNNTFGDLVVATLDPKGEEVARENIARTTGDSGWSCPPDRQPSPSGLFVQPSLDRFVVRVEKRTATFQSDSEMWWTYSLRDGKRASDLVLKYPAKEDKLWYLPVDVVPIPGTDLSAVAWYRNQWEPREEGCRLAVVDQNAQEVWHSEIKTEFAGVEYAAPWLLREASILPAERFSEGVFAYRSVSRQALVKFKVSKQAGDVWKVEEVSSDPEVVTVGRSRQQPPLKADAPALKHLGTVSFGKQPVLDVMEFQFDGEGKLGFIHRNGQGLELLLIDPAQPDPLATAKRTELPLAQDKDLMLAQTAWIGHGRWVVVQGSFDPKKATKALVVDTAEGSVKPMDDFSCPKPAMSRAVVGAGEQGFLILKSFEDSGVVRFDVRGKKLWECCTGESIQDAAIRPDGSIGVLLGIQNVIKEFDAKGTLQREIDLRTAFGHRPNYPTGLEPDADGGWIVHDFGAKKPVLRIALKEGLQKSFEPQYADGRAFRVYGGLRRAPDGGLWTSDHSALLRLNAEGVVERVIGPAPGGDTIQEVRAVGMDRQGLIYLLDGRSSTVHVFDSGGKLQRRLHPLPTDFPADTGIGSLTVAGDGSVFIRPTSFGFNAGSPRYLKFNAAGERVGFQEGRSGEVADDWVANPWGPEMLVLGYERCFLYDGAGKRVKTIERRADDLWLEHPDDAAFAKDGSLVVLAGSHSRDNKPSVTFYTATGEPVRTVELPGISTLARIAFQDHWVCVANESSVQLVDRRSGAVSGFGLAGLAEGSFNQPFFSPKGDELWLVDHENAALTRYAVPPSSSP